MSPPTRRLALAAFLAGLTLPVLAQSVPPIVAAAERGDMAALRQLLAGGAGLEQRDSRGRTALLAATHANQVEAARLLITAGADVNAKDGLRDSAFLYAGAEGRNDILLMTLPRADLRSLNRYGGTALIPAAHHGHVETVRILLGTAIDIDHVNNLGWTALLEAVILGDGGKAHAAIVEMLMRAGARTDIADPQGITALAHARNRGFREIAEIIEAGAGRKAR